MAIDYNWFCDKCGDEIYSYNLVFDLLSEGVGRVCEECFIAYVNKHSLIPEDILDDMVEDGKDYADYLDVYYQTAYDLERNMEDLALEAKREADRELGW